MQRVPRRIFVVWFGPPMNAARQRGLVSLERDAGVSVELVTAESLARWIVPAHPLPAAFEFLCTAHKADYLRAYLMHHHGGGYSDVKGTTGSWLPAFDELDADVRLLGAGYQEIGRHGVASFGLQLRRRYDLQLTEPAWWRYRWLQFNHRRLIGNGAFIYRAGSELTAAWMTEVDRRLERLSPALHRHPARLPKERQGMLIDGVPSQYPVPWSHLMGDIHHPLVHRHRRRLARSVPVPVLEGYQ